mmetsp:Transcript_26000/g.45302  ORF Transcript_26000/g.45302 Transcript_26000/m.45302 type:complete len:386 (+) Transcript_26000:181-1338(+)|eukprot:CAMPEP_0201878892 /NCGR_PEP_ID=MMETSP0902-20130614/9936_1 /ASSEMBLY_ACC=CAM_ASM_000551 /TAXON_ID=420261 /ORGANISM="Thalassiosira antarctica, Strain CCMP982" /LENGTH=385 /DNA_ID=CAMNT_0048406613 /DNA_START=172 /DNA_END=1329 /DNA_ORIENTATION=+
MGSAWSNCRNKTNDGDEKKEEDGDEEEWGMKAKLAPCVICDARFPSMKCKSTVSSKEDEEVDKVVLYFIKNKDPITITSNYSVSAGISVSSSAGINLGGGRGGTQSHADTFRYTVVAAELHKTRRHELILEGMRCLNCLCSLDGVLLDVDRVTVFNTVQNILRTKQLQMIEEFKPSPVRIGLIRNPANNDGGVSKRDPMYIGAPYPEHKLRPLYYGSRFLMQEEIWTLESVSEGDGRTLLKSTYGDYLYLSMGLAVREECESASSNANMEYQWQIEVCGDSVKGKAPEDLKLFGDSTHRRVLNNFVQLMCTPGVAKETRDINAKHYLTPGTIAREDNCFPERCFSGPDKSQEEEAREWVVVLCISRKLQPKTKVKGGEDQSDGTG